MNTSLVCLSALSGNVWDKGFRGEVLYYPICDYDCLPSDVLDMVVADIIKRIERGIDVLLFCQGGHGRTGYVTAAVLGILGDTDPIKTVRRVCHGMIEDNSQIISLASYLQNESLLSYKMEPKVFSYGYNYIQPYVKSTTDYCPVCGADFKGNVCSFCGRENVKSSNKCFLCANWDKDGRNIKCDYCINGSEYVHWKENEGIDVKKCGDCDFYDESTLTCNITGNDHYISDMCDCPDSRKEMEEYVYE